MGGLFRRPAVLDSVQNLTDNLNQAGDNFWRRAGEQRAGFFRDARDVAEGLVEQIAGVATEQRAGFLRDTRDVAGGLVGQIAGVAAMAAEHGDGLMERMERLSGTVFRRANQLGGRVDRMVTKLVFGLIGAPLAVIPVFWQKGKMEVAKIAAQHAADMEKLLKQADIGKELLKNTFLGAGALLIGMRFAHKIFERPAPLKHEAEELLEPHLAPAPEPLVPHTEQNQEPILEESTAEPMPDEGVWNRMKLPALSHSHPADAAEITEALESHVAPASELPVLHTEQNQELPLGEPISNHAPDEGVWSRMKQWLSLPSSSHPHPADALKTEEEPESHVKQPSEPPVPHNTEHAHEPPSEDGVSEPASDEGVLSRMKQWVSFKHSPFEELPETDEAVA